MTRRYLNNTNRIAGYKPQYIYEDFYIFKQEMDGSYSQVTKSLTNVNPVVYNTNGFDEALEAFFKEYRVPKDEQWMFTASRNPNYSEDIRNAEKELRDYMQVGAKPCE